MGNAWSCLTCLVEDSSKMANAYWRCLSCSSSSEDENVIDISVLKTIQDVSQVDELISLIEKRLNVIANATATSQQGSTGTSVQQTASSSPLPQLVKFGKDLLEKVLKGVHGSKRRFMSRVDRVTRKVISDVAKELAKSNLLAAGLSAVVYVLDQIEQVSRNKKQCVQLLAYMCDLAKRVKHLDEHLPQEKEKLTEAIKFIVKGSIMCVGLMRYHYLARFFSSSVEAADLQSIESQILHIYPDLTLAAITAVLERTPVVLPPSQGEDQGAVGIEKEGDDVKQLLKMGLNDISRIAVVVYGIGGVGKTTLATAVFRSLNLAGYKFCRLDMDEMFSNDHLKQLQEQMLLDLFDKKIKLRSHVEGRDEVRKSFREAAHPIFMFIDNALRSDDLAKLLPEEPSGLPRHTRILITTRKLDETDMFKDSAHIQRHPYSVNFLSPVEAKELLCKKAMCGANRKFPESADIDGLVSICGGIPLVLEMVGSKLRKYVDDVSGCKDKVESLKESLIEGKGEMSERVVDVVYNSLDEDCKEAFLDVACFFHNRERRIVGYAVGKVELQALEDAALVKVFREKKEYKPERFYDLKFFVRYVDYNEEGILKVHDIVRARGRRLSQSDRITDKQSLEDALQDTQKLQKIKGISLSSVSTLEAEQLDMMSSSLRVIDTKYLQINGRCRRSFENLKYVEFLYDTDLPMDLNKLKRVSVLIGGDITDNVGELPVSLHLLRLRHVSNLPSLVENLGNLLSLEELCIEDTKAKKTLVSLPHGFGQLKSLRILDLSYFENLRALPENFGNLSALEGLSLRRCSQLESLPPNFGGLKSLRFLDMSWCSEVVTLPDSFANLSALQYLSLADCNQLVSLPPTFGQLNSLVLLTLDETNLTTIPDSFGNLFSLKWLVLSGSSQLLTLPANFGHLKSLEFLCMDLCNLATLPDSFGNLIALNKLILYNCSNLASLPVSIGQLESLSSMVLIRCDTITTFPESFGNLSALKILRVKDWSGNLWLPLSFGQLNSLKELKMSGCDKLSTLPHQIGQLKSLVHLDISSCKGLQTLSCDFRCLTSLATLNASGCSVLEGNSIDKLVEMESLVFLDIFDSPMLIERWEQVKEHHLLIVLRYGYNRSKTLQFACNEAISNALFNPESTFSNVDGDGQLVVRSTSCFPASEAKLAFLVTVCDLSSPANNMALEIVKTKCEELASKDFHIIYVEMENVLQKSEERMRQVLSHLPAATQAWMAAGNKKSQLFCYALCDSWRSCHTVLVSAIVCLDADNKRRVKDLKTILPRDYLEYSEALTDLQGGLGTQFNYIDELENNI